MPFKSEAQRRKFQQMVKDGKLTQATYDAFAAETKGRLPERVRAPESKSKRRFAKVIK